MNIGTTKQKRKLVAFVGFLLAATTLQAQVPAGRWEKVDSLQPGTRILVKLKAGDRLEGDFRNSSPDALVLSESIGQERTVAKSMVQSVQTAAKTPDRLRNGALIGMVTGAAAGVVSMVAFANAKTNGPVYWGDEGGYSWLVLAGLVGGGIGSAAGAGVDAAIRGHEVLYQAR